MASARAGNVIGGGDWAMDRIIPDVFRALQKNEAIPVRNKLSTRPWQHVLEPLSGYLTLAASLDRDCNSRQFKLSDYCSAFNFGPSLNSNRTVAEVVDEVLKHMPGKWIDKSDPHAVHEASKLNLSIDKALHMLQWQPTWDFATTIAKPSSGTSEKSMAPILRRSLIVKFKNTNKRLHSRVRLETIAFT